MIASTSSTNTMHPVEGGTNSTSSAASDIERDVLNSSSSSSRIWTLIYSSSAAIALAIGYLLVESVSFHSSSAADDLQALISIITPITAAIGFAWRSKPLGS